MGLTVAPDLCAVACIRSKAIVTATICNLTRVERLIRSGCGRINAAWLSL